MIELAKEILNIEWEIMRLYFDRCGEIGEFDFEELLNSEAMRGEEEGFIAKTVAMYENFPENGYNSPDAFYIIVIMASHAAGKLGLSREIALSFGKGYSFVRTGFISYDSIEPKQFLFHKLFYPLGSVSSIAWDDDPSVLTQKIKKVFERFRSWDENPKSFELDYLLYTKADDTWKEWDKICE
jgi:hypothetical protein